MIKYCEACHKNHYIGNGGVGGYYWGWNDTVKSCKVCGTEFKEIDFPGSDLRDLEKISEDVSFIEAMIELRSKDIIDYNLKMSQFRQQAETKYKEEEKHVPKCPHCNSTNIKPITVLDRGTSIAVLGIFSKKINKSYECKDCKYTW